MKTLLVGGTSALGKALYPVIASFSEVVTAGRQNCDIHLDLSDSANTITLPQNIDVVIHTAAHFGGKSDDEIIEAEKVNVLGTLKLCQAAVKAKIKHFIFISSIYSTCNEEHNQYSIYSLSKKHAEELARFYCSSVSIPLTIIQPAPIYGKEDGFKRHHPFLYSMLDKAMAGEDILLYGSHDPLRNYLYIDDLTSIISKVIQNKTEGTYSCTHMHDVSYSQIAKAAYAAFNTNGVVRFLPDQPNIADNIFIKNDSLYKKIGFYPQVSIEEGIRQIAINKKHQ